MNRNSVSYGNGPFKGALVSIKIRLHGALFLLYIIYILYMCI
jgi:hypothetical protein